MKAVKKSLIAISLLSAASLPALAVEVSGNVAVSSDYKFRGISQSDGEALSGGFDVSFESGFYAGTWGSSIEDWGNGLELDYYAGFAAEASDSVSYDIGILHYGYPNTDSGVDLDFDELYGSVSVADFTFGFAYSDDYFAGTGNYTYLYAEYSLSVSDGWSLDFHYGDNSIDDEAGFGTPDYADYSIGLSGSAAGLDLSLVWVDTDLSDADCFGGDDLCEGSLIVSVSKSL